MAGMNPGGNPFPGGAPTRNPFPEPGGNPFQPNRRIFPQPTWQTGRSDWQVDTISHLDYSVNDQTPRGTDSFDAYHTGKIRTNLADHIKVEWHNCMYNDLGYSYCKFFLIPDEIRSR